MNAIVALPNTFGKKTFNGDDKSQNVFADVDFIFEKLRI